MHELSIATSIHNTVLREIENRKLHSVSAIGLRIGALTDIVPDSLTFSFEIIAKGTPLEKTQLKIETVPIQGSCKNCQKDFTVEEFLFSCPFCYSNDIDMTHGNELEIAYLETDDE